jgi:Zn-dependent protease with chaperone function
VGIQVNCGHCQASFQVKDSFAGQRGKCPRCQGLIEVPRPAGAESGTIATAPTESKSTAVVARRTASPAKVSVADVSQTPESPPAAIRCTDRADLKRRVLDAFQGELPRKAAPISYRVGILIAALVMVVLPFLYLALIAAVGWLVYYHAANHTGLMEMGTGRGRILMVIVYVGPIVAGAIMVLFMIKPLFAPPADEGRTRSLTPQGEPLLYAFVQRICELVHAPMPKKIQVDCDVNASASFRRGMLSMLGNDLVLTIGTPLAAGLTIEQFAGVLAHEFGHFKQGAGMRLTYIVRTINAWFMRVVYQRDEWDEWLAETAEESDLRVGWVLFLAQAGVWIGRRALWVLMMIGHAVSGFMLRQMEYDADRSQTQLVGSEEFSKTFRQIHLLSASHNAAFVDLIGFWKQGRLADNLPKLMIANSQSMPPKVVARIDKQLKEGTAGLFSTHPADKDRIAAARAQQAAGIFRFDGPASLLFSDLDGLARNVTWDMYRGMFGSQFKPSDMHPTEELLATGTTARPAEE